MRAAVLRDGAMAVADDVAEPEPAFGQVLVEVKACGICGSDLHFVHHGHTMLELQDSMGGVPDFGGPRTDLSRDVYMGHEFAAEVLEYGPGTEGPAPGSLVTSIPILLDANGIRPIVYSNETLGGYAERMLLSAPMLVEVPNGLPASRAALTEPMAVGLHAVNKSQITEREGALVLGCGPVGLAVIAALRQKGVETIVATDFSPGRRAIATAMGATEVVDPAVEPAFEAWRRVGGSKTLVTFEAIGVRGILHEVFREAPAQSRLVVVGVCMEQDTIVPFYGIGKELQVNFVVGYDPMEFAGSLRAIAEGEIDVTPMITGEVDLDGVPGAFEALGNPDEHCKILVVP